eukprot:6377239-Amphidinium_carterae.1
MDALEKSSKWQLAMEMFLQLGASRMELSRVAYNIAISACERGIRWRQSLQLFSDVAHHGVL